MSDFSLRQIISHAAFSSPILARILAASPRRRKPTSAPGAALWDKDFSRGRWDWLGGLDELAHRAVIAGYVARLNPDGYVLDVGCGAGITEKLLRRWCAGYHGVDLSAVAVAKAQADALPSARFTVADAHLFVPDQAYDDYAPLQSADTIARDVEKRWLAKNCYLSKSSQHN